MSKTANRLVNQTAGYGLASSVKSVAAAGYRQR